MVSFMGAGHGIIIFRSEVKHMGGTLQTVNVKTMAELKKKATDMECLA